MSLPEGVQAVQKPNGKTYYYFAPKRSTKHAGPRISLGSDPTDPEFWRILRGARGPGRAGSFDQLIQDYKASPEWGHLRPRTRTDYGTYLDRLSLEAGDRAVSVMTRADLYKLRDQMSGTPVAANHMLSVLRTIIEWSIPRGYRDDNPVVGIKRLVIEEDGAAPWPDEGYGFVIAQAPDDIRRMAFLGRATGQRAGDLVRMKPSHLEADGINVWIGKRREMKHFVPLTAAQMAEIRSWDVSPLDLFLKSTRNKPYTATHLNSRWNRWRESEEAKPIRGLKMTIHGLRATAIADRRRQGAADGAIADELGMSPQMVNRYSRFADKADLARASRDRREQTESRFVNLKVS